MKNTRTEANVCIEVIVEHLQSAWVPLGEYTHFDRYERQWPLDTTQYHLQAAEKAAKHLFQLTALVAPRD